MPDVNLSDSFEPKKHRGHAFATGEKVYSFSASSESYTRDYIRPINVGANTSIQFAAPPQQYDYGIATILNDQPLSVPFEVGANTSIQFAAPPQQYDYGIATILNDQPFATCLRIRHAMLCLDRVLVYKDPYVGEINIISSPSAETSPNLLCSDEVQEAQARTLLQAIVNAPSRSINLLFAKLSLLPSPQIVLNTALNEYRTSGRERYISMAASVLQSMGEKAWPALRDLAKSAPPEAELFVPIIADCVNVSSDERSEALIHLAASQHSNVRAAVLDNLTELPKERVNAIVQIVANTPETKSHKVTY